MRRDARSLRVAAVALANLFAASAVLGLVGASPALAGPYTASGHSPGAMIDWAREVVAFTRGPLDIVSPGGGNASFGLPEYALGPATGDTFDVVSLGDGGSITLAFDFGIGDHPGDDFAVFENGFQSPNGFFGEFAFVEVSSNGSDFARFPAIALQAIPVPDGGTVDPTDYANLAGRHALGVGTGFDLADLAEHPLAIGGQLDLSDVAYVRIVDVIGDGSTLDDDGEPVYDPYPTAYAVGGHDLEAVGVIHAPEADGRAMFFAAASFLGVLSRRRKPACRAPR
jgi:hypothetical protein